jgi:hypothetical protein
MDVLTQVISLGLIGTAVVNGYPRLWNTLSSVQPVIGGI